MSDVGIFVLVFGGAVLLFAITYIIAGRVEGFMYKKAEVETDLWFDVYYARRRAAGIPDPPFLTQRRYGDDH